jgi:hypothetical protein
MSKAKLPADPNLRLPESVLGRPLVIQHSRLAGFRHHAAPRLWPALRSGTPLALSAEEDNPHDPDAVAVYWQGTKLGYLPRTENLVASRLLARHRGLSARVRRLVPEAEDDRRLELDVLMH